MYASVYLTSQEEFHLRLIDIKNSRVGFSMIIIIIVIIIIINLYFFPNNQLCALSERGRDKEIGDR